jgi:hypothetical protein
MSAMHALLAFLVCVSSTPLGLKELPAPVHAVTTTHFFYADKAKVGEVYAGMTLVDLDVNVETNDVTARFTGEAVISGTYVRLPDDDSLFPGLSFHVDSDSLTQLPALATDERDGKQFLFVSEDENDLLKSFGNPKPGVKGKATIVITDYFINHQHKEVTDTARLVRIIKLGE